MKRRNSNRQRQPAAQSGRLASPDSPQDRRAVAAAAAAAAYTQHENKSGGNASSGGAPYFPRTGGGRVAETGTLTSVGSRRKPLLLTSRSLDDHVSYN